MRQKEFEDMKMYEGWNMALSMMNVDEELVHV